MDARLDTPWDWICHASFRHCEAIGYIVYKDFIWNMFGKRYCLSECTLCDCAPPNHSFTMQPMLTRRRSMKPTSRKRLKNYRWDTDNPMTLNCYVAWGHMVLGCSSNVCLLVLYGYAWPWVGVCVHMREGIYVLMIKYEGQLSLKPSESVCVCVFVCFLTWPCGHILPQAKLAYVCACQPYLTSGQATACLH